MNHDPVWERLGAPPPTELADAREQAHWAVQVLVGVATASVEAAPDDSHTSLTWDCESHALLTQPLEGTPGTRAALRVPDLTLAVHDSDEGGGAESRLAGATLADGYAWMENALGASGALPQRTEEMPDHPVGSGAAFAADPAALAELARWYSNAELALQEVRASNAGAGAVRVWPHHFDVATLITLDPDAEPERARSIGVGMTPGDASYAQPYFYVLPWPAPQRDELPLLQGGGKWHREGWVGAVLTGEDLVSGGVGEEEQLQRARAFLASAVSRSRDLLKRSG
jgi:hypothetical protein